MYYIYMIGSVIVALLLISISCVVPMYMIKEFDKMTYIKGYKQNLKWYKLPLLYVRNLVIFVFYILSFGWLSIFVLYQQIDKYYLLKKQSYVVYSSMFVTPLVGIGFGLAIAFASYQILYILELEIIMTILLLSYALLLFILVPMYLILSVKQLINIYRVENQQLEEQYSKFWEKDKQSTIKAILQNKVGNQYVDEYLQVYDSVDEWKQSRYVTINHNLVPKLIGVTILVGYVINILISVVANEILDLNAFILIGFVILLATNVIILLNYMFNSSILLDISQKIALSMQKIVKLVFLSIIGLLITFIICDNMLYLDISRTGPEMTYQERKELTTNEIKSRKEYLNYSTYEKRLYISKYFQYFEDDFETIGYKYDKYENILVPIDNYEIINFLQPNTEDDLYLHIDIPFLYITGSDVLEIEGTELIIENNEDFFTYNSEQKAKEYEDNNIHSYDYLANNEIEQAMKEEAVAAIDNLWNEEMKDRGLI